MSAYGSPINLNAWLIGNAEALRPPVGNQQIWSDSDLLVTVVGGPNQRTDFHDDPFEEFFYQLHGDASILIADRGKFERVALKQGSVFLLPGHVRHSPQRPAPESRCLVVERSRPSGLRDGFEWYCSGCGVLVFRAECQLVSIVEDLPRLFSEFYTQDALARTCRSCGSVHPGKDWQAWHRQLASGRLAT